jgi:H+/Cl- antiporter ClcA
METPFLLVAMVRAEFGNRHWWQTRAVVLAFAALAGVTVVLFTWLTEHALAMFNDVQSAGLWWPLLWTPFVTAVVVWATQRWAPGAAGSGIPQVMAALHTGTPVIERGLFVSMRLAMAKMFLTSAGLLAGLSMGREGPSVQIAAGMMHAARRWLPARTTVSDHGLLIAGGAAGIAAAFNTPLGGIMFAIEELSRRPEQRSNGLLMAAIVLSGLIGVSAFGNSTYFGVIRVTSLGWSMLGPGLVVVMACGLSGGLFSRLLVVSLSGASSSPFNRWRQQAPIRFAAACGLVVAVIGLVSNGATFGSGYLHTRALLAGSDEPSSMYLLLKFLATWITAWSGVPGGIFAPALAMGAALGADVAHWMGGLDRSALMAIGMAGFLAAVTQAPLTAFIIVMEMVDGHNMVLSLMAGSLIASGISRMISAPLYPSLAEVQLRRLPQPSLHTA